MIAMPSFVLRFLALVPCASLWLGSTLPAQITLLKDLNPGKGSSITSLGGDFWTEFRGKFVFRATTPATGPELFISDGTPAGTRLLLDINPGTQGSSPRLFAKTPSILYFLATEPKTGRELWAFDGLKVWLVKDLTPGSGSTWSYSYLPKGPYRPLYYRGKLYFHLYPTLLFETDGTASGTRSTGIRNIYYLRNFGNRVICKKLMSGYGQELVITDMTPAGTKLVKDIWPGSRESLIQDLTVYRGRCYFFAHDGKHGFEPWVSDGTARGTMMLKDTSPGIEPTRRTWSQGLWRGDVRGFVGSGEEVFFATSTRLNGQEVWATRGTPASTRRLTDIAPGYKGSWPEDFLPTPRGIVFRIISPLSPPTIRGLYSLAMTNGSPTLTKLTTDRPDSYLALGDRYLWFQGGLLNGRAGREVWRSDYTAKGTRMFKDYVPGPGSFAPDLFLAIGGKVFLAGATATTGKEPYVLDPGAVTMPHGRGCGGTGAEPRLTTSDPVLDGFLELRGEGAPVGPGAPTITVTIIGQRDGSPPTFMTCDIYPDLKKPAITYVGTVNGKTWKITVGKIPNTPSLKGVEIEVQTFYLKKNGLAGTNGVTLYPGQ